MNSYVLVTDICCSTIMIETLVSNGQENEYKDLIDSYQKEITKQASVGIEIYKFLGDGFIILFKQETDANSIIEFIQNLTTNMNEIIKRFIHNFIDRDIESIGLSFGLSYGPIHRLEIPGFKTEYFGRPINLAARFQSSTTESNTILLQNEVYRLLTNKNLKEKMIETKRQFKNINGSLRCYQFRCLKDDMRIKRKDKNDFIDKQSINYKNVILTPLDKQIIFFISEKKSAREICTSIGITTSTFVKFKNKVYPLFNVKSGEELIMKLRSLPISKKLILSD